MTLATILVTVLALGFAGSAVQDQALPATQSLPPSAQNPDPGTTSNPQQQNPSTAPKPRRHRKKVSTLDCSASSTTAKSTNPQSNSPGAANSSNPCPPKKVIVKNGGSDEPAVQLKGDAPAAKASDDRLSTEQLRLATEENLKKIAERQLDSNQQDMLNQIKQFLDQSKAAIADGDLERGHNLAMKARLLSDELVTP